MRARNIKPDFFKNESLADCPPLARLLFAGLWCLADRDGRLEDRPRKIKSEILPYDECDVDDLLSYLTDKMFILRYERNARQVIQVVNFDKHQKPHPKETSNKFPAPEGVDIKPVKRKPDLGTAEPDLGMNKPGLIPHNESLIMNASSDGTHKSKIIAKAVDGNAYADPDDPSLIGYYSHLARPAKEIVDHFQKTMGWHKGIGGAQAAVIAAMVNDPDATPESLKLCAERLFVKMEATNTELQYRPGAYAFYGKLGYQEFLLGQTVCNVRRPSDICFTKTPKYLEMHPPDKATPDQVQEFVKKLRANPIEKAAL